jgi:uncharacterized phage protein (TIGR02220 family)
VKLWIFRVRPFTETEKKRPVWVVSKQTQRVVSNPVIRIVLKTTHSKESFKENILSGKPDDLPENSKNPKKQNDKISFAESIEHLNHKASKNFLANSKSTQTHIKARFAEGFILPDFITVINRKASQWSTDQKMAAYLRPETLFGPKFEDYLNESLAVDFMVLTLRTTTVPAGQRSPLCRTTTETTHIKFTAIFCAATGHGMKRLEMTRQCKPFILS